MAILFVFPQPNAINMNMGISNKHIGSYFIFRSKQVSSEQFSFHLVTTDMELKPNCGSDRAWVWNVSADYADEEPRKETLAIKFGNAESMSNLYFNRTPSLV